MRRHFVLLIGCLSFFTVKAQIKIEHKLNKTFSLLQFGEHIGNNQGSGRFSRELFQSSKYSEDTSLTERRKSFSTLDFASRITSQGYPENHKLSNDAWNIIAITAADCESIEVFKKRTFGFVPAQTHKQLFEMLLKMNHVYEELVRPPQQG